MDSIELLSKVSDYLVLQVKKDIRKCLNFEKDIWFWHFCERFKLLKYLNFSEESVLVETARSLLYAFEHAGTMESLIQLSKGLFGKDSIVLIEDTEIPATLKIKIKNANTKFLYTLLADEESAIAFKENRALCLAFSDLANAVSFNPRSFFKSFLTPGRVLKSLDITSH